MSQATSRSRMRWRISPQLIYFGVGALILIVALAATNGLWLPKLNHWLSDSGLPFLGSLASDEDSSSEDAVSSDSGSNDRSEDEHASHDHSGHDHAGHDEGNSLEMSEQARKNIGLRVEAVKLETYVKSAAVPGIVVEQPGKSALQVTAILTGVITRIYPIEGEAVTPGQPLFDLRMTHEELVQSQAALLQTAEELEVNSREIQRIEKLTRNGAIAAKQLLERQYERQKLEVVLRSSRQTLLLHGLTNEQIDEILAQRELLKDLVVVAPTPNDNATGVEVVYQVQELRIAQGQHVNAGDTLAVLADHSQLYIQGDAFERDVALVARAAADGAPVSALLETEGGRPETVNNLRVLYLASKVDPEERTQEFYVTLPNVKQRDATVDGRRFIAWAFRPGQRMQLQIPVETFAESFVLPVEAIAQDGVESYVFAPNGDHFDRLPVHVKHRDTRSAVIASDGSIFPGDLVAMNGAQQLQLALKNKAGGGIDPHAGHNH